MATRPIVVSRGVAPPPPRQTTQAYPWDELGPPQEMMQDDGTKQIVMDSFFVPGESKNASSTIGKARERHPGWDFEWRPAEEIMEHEHPDTGQLVTGPVRGIRYWRTK